MTPHPDSMCIFTVGEFRWPGRPRDGRGSQQSPLRCPDGQGPHSLGRAKQPVIWTTPAPTMDPQHAQLSSRAVTSASSVRRRQRRSRAGPGFNQQRRARR